MTEKTKERSPRTARLLRSRDAVLASLPPFSEVLRGSFFERTVRCGKPSCRCASGTGHPVACVGVTFAGGRTEQISVPRHLIPLARRWVGNYQRWWRAVERISQINRCLLRERLLTSSPPGPKRRR